MHRCNLHVLLYCVKWLGFAKHFSALQNEQEIVRMNQINMSTTGGNADDAYVVHCLLYCYALHELYGPKFFVKFLSIISLNKMTRLVY